MNQLTKYEAAKRALSEARNVDEVKDIRDKAIAMRIYAQQAKDRSLEEDALQIRYRAERRLGQMMREQPKAYAKDMKGNQHTGRELVGVSGKPQPITLAKAGIDKNLAHRARKLAAMPEKEFEAQITEASRELKTSLDKPPDRPQPMEDITLVIHVLNSLDLDKYSRDQLRQFHGVCLHLVHTLDVKLSETNTVVELRRRKT